MARWNPQETESESERRVRETKEAQAKQPVHFDYYASVIALLDGARKLTQMALDEAIRVQGTAVHGNQHERGEQVIKALLYYRTRSDNAWTFVRRIERGEVSAFSAEWDFGTEQRRAERNESHFPPR